MILMRSSCYWSVQARDRTQPRLFGPGASPYGIVPWRPPREQASFDRSLRENEQVCLLFTDFGWDAWGISPAFIWVSYLVVLLMLTKASALAAVIYAAQATTCSSRDRSWITTPTQYAMCNWSSSWKVVTKYGMGSFAVLSLLPGFRLTPPSLPAGL